MENSGSNNAFNLLEESKLSIDIVCSVPSADGKAWRQIEFAATYRVLDEEQEKELDAKNLNQRDYLREVLIDIEGLPAAKDPTTGEVVSPVEVGVRNRWTQDSLWAEYNARLGKNSRDVLIRSADVKNSGRSRKR